MKRTNINHHLMSMNTAVNSETAVVFSRGRVLESYDAKSNYTIIIFI